MTMFDERAFYRLDVSHRGGNRAAKGSRSLRSTVGGLDEGLLAL
ncbi:hypothetical protein ACGLWX_15565 [Halomonas sp. HMF6819]|nr:MULTISPECIES: hypothetical protein [unclassified Halomonas]